MRAEEFPLLDPPLSEEGSSQARDGTVAAAALAGWLAGWHDDAAASTTTLTCSKTGGIRKSLKASL